MTSEKTAGTMKTYRQQTAEKCDEGKNERPQTLLSVGTFARQIDVPRACVREGARNNPAPRSARGIGCIKHCGRDGGRHKLQPHRGL
jgi:hypothetical protein